MRAIVLHCVLLMVLATSCSSKDDVKEPTLDVNSEKWELVKMISSGKGIETTGQDMEWQEYYIFNSNATFIKSRVQDGQTIEASGKYVKDSLGGEEFLELKYINGVELIANCTGTKVELLYYKKGGVLRGVWSACDGPELEYEQLKK
ncbi:hypothetical protein [uncultured Maribacter sp.]|uniref:hypothetical protein n=1 Tax=uncultured Maribacter sp. TaxID=431308 RepID=UPI00260FA064|nr:hypothetical protein [uncultured Maribacter sp.]